MAIDGEFKKLKDTVSSALVDTTRTAGQISNEDLQFLRTSDPSVVTLLEQQNTRLLRLGQRLTKVAVLGTEVPVPQFKDADSIEDSWREIVDVFDIVLEKADACLDEFTGAVRRLSPSQEEQIKKAAVPARKSRPDKAYRTQNIAKPQLLFEDVPTNNESTPFKPLLRSKPHAIIPLEESIVLDPSDSSQQYKHPYETEIRGSRYPFTVYTKVDPTPYVPYENSVATMVDTPEALFSMLDELKLAKEIAVDLEHHDEHSYIGLVSLMQISTRNKDWIIDTLKPWRRALQILNEVFTDPKILKVFHGAYMDMIWLQRDFGIYVVGLFDTFHASRALRYPKNGLAYLLKHFVDFDAAKQYQMADWRLRPLPEEMFNYARSDTHFLLYIYDNLRNELVEKSNSSEPGGDLVEVVMNKSKAEALQQYERPLYDSDHGLGTMGWSSLLYRTPALFNREQFAVFKAVHQWRDSVARQEDESVHAVMPKHVLYKIARAIPTDEASLYGCSHPMSKPFMKKKKSLLKAIQQAKLVGATGPDMKDVLQAIQPFYVERHTGASTDHRSASVFQDLTQAPAPSNPQSQPNIIARTKESLFWGPLVMGNSSKQGLEVKCDHESICLSLPLPQLTAELYEDSKFTRSTGSLLKDPGAHFEHLSVKSKISEDENLFVVKQASSSQKRKASESNGRLDIALPSANCHVVGNNDQDTDISGMAPSIENPGQSAELNEKKRFKAAKKEARRLDKARQADAMIVGEVPGNVEAFDYSNAPSVLHARRSDNHPDGSKSANPYLKSMNAPKGMRKTKMEAGGKSFTFKD